MLYRNTFYNFVLHIKTLQRTVRPFSSLKVDNEMLPTYDQFNPQLRATIQQLDSIAPRFEIAKDEIEILKNPVDFYSQLKAKILKAQDRIFLSSLYLGKSQHELVQCLSDSLDTNPKVKVTILLDCLRSTRDAPHKSTASLLVPLVEKFGKDRVDIRFYHTPHLSGLTKHFLPKRINEGWGLQHMKIYGFDNEVILSGANLSEDYFTNRQDRYYIFKNINLTNYYYKVQEAVSLLSYQVLPFNNPQQFILEWPTENKSSEPHLNLHHFIRDSTKFLLPILKTHQTATSSTLSNPETIVYPISSFKPLLNPDYSTEKQSILRCLTHLANKEAGFTFTAGYFNMHPDIQSKIQSSFCKGEIITASPKANSFYKSGGISYYLPAAYLLNSLNFLKSVEKNEKHQIKLLEWENGEVNTKNGWSYHAKGIWINVANEIEPSITVIGSSNYTKRAYNLDLETNALIITKDEDLKKQMYEEINHLKKHTKELKLEDFEKEEERQVGWGVRIAARLLSGML